MYREDRKASTITTLKYSTFSSILSLLLLVLVVVPLLVTQLLQQLLYSVEAWSNTITITTFIHQLHKYKQQYSFINTRRSNHHVVPFMVKADPFRDGSNNNCIRPSLHPITINILAQILKLRAASIVFNTHSTIKNNNTATFISTAPSILTLKDDIVWSDQPLDVVMMVSTIASKAIQQRQQTSTIDQMTFTIVFSPPDKNRTRSAKSVVLPVRCERMVGSRRCVTPVTPKV